MKNSILIIFFFLSINSKAQCRKTFLYGFELYGIYQPKKIIATVFYNGKIIVPKVKTICGKLLKIKTTFIYIQNSAKSLGGVKLPYQLPSNTFYWLMTDDMNIEMATHPDRFKIVLNSNDNNMKRKYQLPITYDFIAQNAIYLDLLDKSESNIKNEFANKIWKFSLYEKETKPIIKDSILVFSVRKGIPAGIKIRFPEINEQTVRSVQEYATSGMLYKGKLFLKMAENKTVKPDAQRNFYVAIDGGKCATSGGILGFGFGECGGAEVQKNNRPIQYQISIQIEP